MRTNRAGSAHPLDELCAEVDRLWTTLIAAPPLHGWGSTPRGAFPAVNVRETDDAVMVEAELPGLAPSDVSVSVADDTLSLAGERSTATVRDGGDVRDEEVVWHMRERGGGRFERRIPLGAAVAADRVEARLVDGVLTVRCPKAPEARPHRVPVSGT